MNNNNHLHSLIKLRHLKNASQNNWEMLSNTKQMVSAIISDAKQVIENNGKDLAITKFTNDSKTLTGFIDEIQESLNEFGQFIKNGNSINTKQSFEKFNKTLEKTKDLFNTIASYPDSDFNDLDNNEWREIWYVILSNLSIVQGVGESAFIKCLMIENFNNTEVDSLTNEIVRHIPQSFNLLEADKYKQEYMKAVKQMEEESNAKDNLWDRFLNVLAGGVPFKQTPEERVMMMRWLDGEKGEL